MIEKKKEKKKDGNLFAQGRIRLISAKVTMMTDDLISLELLTRRTTGRPRSEKMSVVNGCLVLRNNERKNVKKKEVSCIARRGI